MRKKKKITDPNEMAFDVMTHTIQKSEEKILVTPEVSAAARALSRLGASKGGKARAKKLSAEKRTEIAKKAAKKRWLNKIKK